MGDDWLVKHIINYRPKEGGMQVGPGRDGFSDDRTDCKLLGSEEEEDNHYTHCFSVDSCSI